MKILGLILTTLAGFYAGRAMSCQLSERVDILTQLKLFINATGTKIRFSSSEIYDIFKEFSDTRQFSKLDFLPACIVGMENGMTFQAAWEDAVSRSCVDRMLNDEEKDIINGLGGAFGTTDVEGQMSICRMYEELLDVKLEQARQKKQQCSKLYSGLGTMLGLGIAILMF